MDKYITSRASQPPAETGYVFRCKDGKFPALFPKSVGESGGSTAGGLVALLEQARLNSSVLTKGVNEQRAAIRFMKDVQDAIASEWTGKQQAELVTLRGKFDEPGALTPALALASYSGSPCYFFPNVALDIMSLTT